MRYLPFLLALALSVYAFVDAVQSPRQAVRVLPKSAWLVAVWVPVLGPAAWLLAGRPDRSGSGDGPRPAPRPVGPDDDPDFLRRLRDAEGEHERTLRQWQREIERREARERGTDPPAPSGRPAGDDEPPPA